MTTPFIRFDAVGKSFRRGASHDSLRDLVPHLLRRFSGREEAAAVTRKREFWALHDVSFTVEPGEVLGIIGTNGAGKSTALKILNRIIEPTQGIAEVQGRVGALIEVSAGFHQDLSGRQNVYLQGAIMGMRQEEVRRKFDDIVGFAGVEDFIDTPVKRYSSGMNARLGFSIAAHLEPEVLLIDEVLAVGDHAFQTRAFGRIKDMARAGAPVVIVSHQLDRVAELCTKAILLEKGRIRTSGTPAHCIDDYLHGNLPEQSDTEFEERRVRLSDLWLPSGGVVRSGEELQICLKGEALEGVVSHALTPNIRVVSLQTGQHVHAVTGRARGISFDCPGAFEYIITLQMNVSPGLYCIESSIWDVNTSRDAMTGPRTNVEVIEGLVYWGEAQLNLRWVSK